MRENDVVDNVFGFVQSGNVKCRHGGIVGLISTLLNVHLKRDEHRSQKVTWRASLVFWGGMNNMMKVPGDHMAT